MTIQIVTATIQAGQSLSAAVAIPGTILGFGIPANWTAAPLSFQTSVGGPYAEIYRDGNPYAISGIAGSYATENRNYWGGVTTLIIRSGTSDTPVVQVSATSITIPYDDGQ